MEAETCSTVGWYVLETSHVVDLAGECTRGGALGPRRVGRGVPKSSWKEDVFTVADAMMSTPTWFLVYPVSFRSVGGVGSAGGCETCFGRKFSPPPRPHHFKSAQGFEPTRRAPQLPSLLLKQNCNPCRGARAKCFPPPQKSSQGGLEEPLLSLRARDALRIGNSAPFLSLYFLVAEVTIHVIVTPPQSFRLEEPV